MSAGRSALPRVVRFLLVLAAGGVVACNDPAEPTSSDGGPRGPAGGRLTFDAAMLEPPSEDAGLPTFRDGGPRDAGLPTPRDAGSRSCTGVVTSCDLVLAGACSTQRGCFASGECTGSARGCYSYYEQWSCSSQDGCYWSSSSDYCSGSSRSCTSRASSSSCSTQDGCYWSDGCDGVATSCSLLSETECFGQRGCYLR